MDETQQQMMPEPPQTDSVLAAMTGGGAPVDAAPASAAAPAAPAPTAGDALVSMSPVLAMLMSMLNSAYQWGAQLGAASTARTNTTGGGSYSARRDDPAKVLAMGSIPPQAPSK